MVHVLPLCAEKHEQHEMNQCALQKCLNYMAEAASSVRHDEHIACRTVKVFAEIDICR